MKRENHFAGMNQKGFTLIELIAVMIIMGVVASIALNRYESLSDAATQQVLTAAVRELNVRECLTWTNIKVSREGYTDDENVYAALDTDLGPKFKWNPGPGIGGGTLHSGIRACVLVRTPSSFAAAGRWH
jgi:prepilin-type N-terminal cleavage/methylation domain-containing protein